MAHDWLPELMPFSGRTEEWHEYVEQIYAWFYNDFVESQPRFESRRCGHTVEPKHDGKHQFFWHLVSEGSVEADRLPDLRRCERIRWPRPVIERSPQEGILTWQTKRGKHRRLLIALDDFSYVVVLEDRKTYLIALTAFCVEDERRRDKFRKEQQRGA